MKDPERSTVFDIFDHQVEYIVPKYQRHYGWGNWHCTRLWKDILMVLPRAGKPEKRHFIGSIVIVNHGNSLLRPKSTIIDGQQRLTTLILILLALRNHANSQSDKPENLIQEINKLLKSENNRYSLHLTDVDDNLLVDLIEGRKLSINQKSNLLGNYQYFEEKMARAELAPQEIYEALKRLDIVVINLDEKDNAQEIFESLNSTGKELSKSDLIRNYVLMGLNPQDQDKVYDDHWKKLEELFDYDGINSEVMDNFFRDYLTMKLVRIPTKNMVYEEFKKFHKNSKLSNYELCEDLHTHARYYTDIIYGRNSKNDSIKSLYQDIADLKMEVSYPFLLKVYSDLAERLIDDSDFEKILQLCVSYVFRRGVCNIPSVSLNKTFSTLQKYIKKNDYLNSVKFFFVSQETYKKFPNDAEFTADLMTRDIYNTRNCKFFLEHIAKFNNKYALPKEQLSIEHIMPQNPNLNESWRNQLGKNWQQIQKTYLHTVGNLTLTAYNSEMGDLPFEKKKATYGGFVYLVSLNESLKDRTKWNKKAITKRAEDLAKIAKVIWAFPMTEEELATYVENHKYDATNDQISSIESYDMSDTTRHLFDILNERILSLSPQVTRNLKRKYIAYKLDTNFVDLKPRKKKLLVYVNLRFKEVSDPHMICRDVSRVGHHGNGEVLVTFTDESELDQVMDVIKQSFSVHSE